ncbi:facilitated trehalose transporter Tret1-2 homolog isoform X1 [Drosophila nasuta]|uniref:Facilitated trehalose transporter Tret1-2 homolog isoform X1 n=2 Tax=Drosophila albomicans TaxID=7291 RepID=A0A6P8YPL7_DROAB|nr:facilitated trehalose transporter Tret1-2 homolog isoform X1 [Drosophila albomicans]XP_060651710.1 facilitated trehalose transporter Tret1-2 homolog isoform X1 [Drosophila nasuta]
MSTASYSNSSGDEANKKAEAQNEESSHLLETNETNGAKYGSRQAVKIVKANATESANASPQDQENLLGNMVHTSTENKSRTLPQYVAALAAAGGAFAAGTLLGWTSPSEKEITDGDAYSFDVNDEQFSWVGAFMTLGAAVVCIPIGFLINFIGRKWTMLLLVLPFVLGWALLIWAQNVVMMYIARFILGIAGGAFCVTAPMYTGEISQKDIRGTLGSFFQLMITIGILFVYGVGSGLNVFWMSIVCGLLPIIFGIIFFFMPESPTYLVSKNRSEAAIKSIQWLRGKEYDYAPEMEELHQIDREIREQEVNIWAALTRPVTIKAMSISLGLMFFQQVSGINAVIFYSAGIFTAAKTGINESMSTILIGVMQVVATFVSTLVVDKLGRRILLLASGIVMALSTTAIGVYFFLKDQDEAQVENLGWLPVTSLCVFIIMFSIGFGPVPWLMMGELFATDIKGFAGSIAGTTNWVLAFIITKTFKNLTDGLGTGGTFWLFAGLTVVGIVFVFFIVPETKGKSLNEIQQELAGNRSVVEQSNGVQSKK